MSKLLGVEAGRGVAALLVVMVHATNMLVAPKHYAEPAFGGLFKFGHAGVDFFFVLSGFIICFIHADELERPEFLKAYWWKRLVRIYPVYWVVLAGFGLLLAVSPTKELLERIPSVVAASILLIPHEKGPILGVAWTLSHELLFYLLFSVLFVSLRWGAILMGAWLLGIVVNIATGWFDAHYLGQFLFRLFNLHFFVGIAVAVLIRRGFTAGGRVALWAGPLIFLAAGVSDSMVFHFRAEWPPLHLVYALSAGLSLYGLVTQERAGRLTVPPWLARLGSASYSLYLLHVIVIMVVMQALLWLRPIVHLEVHLAFAVVALAAVLVSVMFSDKVELPLLRRLRPPPTRSPSLSSPGG